MEVFLPHLGTRMKRFLKKQRMNHEYNNAHHNAAIRNIERGPVISENMEIKKIRNRAKTHTVNHISHRAADDQNQASTLNFVLAFRQPDHKPDRHQQ